MYKPVEDNEWKLLLKGLSEQFNADLDIQGILFLIGLQELGKGAINLSKDQKVEIMHVAVCTLLAKYGYYEFERKDAEGWPHWKLVKQLPALNSYQQQMLMKRSIIDYFKKEEN